MSAASSEGGGGSRLRVVLHPAHPPAVDEVLARSGVDLLRPGDDDGVARALADGAEVLVTYTWRADFLTPLLRWIAGTGAGTEQYPLDLLADRGVVLTTASGVHASCVAEHAFALLLACTRRLGESVRHMTERRWVPLAGDELGGKRLLIVGLGRIGEEVARRAEGWDVSVAGIKRDTASYRGRVTDVRAPDQLDEMCRWADAVVLAAPANASTRHVIGARQLEALGAGWLVNVGRGSLVDEDALIDALTNGQLRGAGLDVTGVEPLETQSRLWDLPGVVLSAHNAGDSPAFGTRWGEIFQANQSALLGEGTWINQAVPSAQATG